MTDDLLSPDEVRAALRAYFADRPGLDETRLIRDGDPAVAGAGFDRERWRVLADEVGLLAMAAPEEADGLGLGLEHLTAAAEEAGASLYPGPFRASVLLAWALRAGGAATSGGDLIGDPVGHAGGVLTGTAVAGVPQAFASHDPGLRMDAEGRVSGEVRHVTHGPAADVLLAVARAPHGAAAVLVPLGGGRGSVTRRAAGSVDLTATLGDLHLDAVPALPLSRPGDVATLARIGDVARLLLAAEQVGGAQGCLDHAVGYAKIRSQFGRLIGVNQAIQHRCAGMAVDVVAARALVLAAARAIDTEDERAHLLVLLAKAEASQVFGAAAEALIQVHGGIGFTWEHDAHLFYRRAKATAVLDGQPVRLRDTAAASGCLSLLAG
ncbi:acyl-CoA/acyl-ACP dehydrogenase [Microtetraspora sp. AC03309]|uniref:acyl-CoA dehydrogenase family protein n=1 Tax=Microtetraspora sp. AC03309 TaxID=2779376 RepID=UPI001E58A82A|nr:acyl-CoA dehydrogenase family protein [Microtetraspora sp. AC03309]MCC5579967.1 acyl-CoA/acyl-ACP dehydrogenase [Microtetraspora sp. AC03309]